MASPRRDRRPRPGERRPPAGRGGFQRSPDAFGPGKPPFRDREGGVREGGFRERGFREREGGFDRRPGGFRDRERPGREGFREPGREGFRERGGRGPGQGRPPGWIDEGGMSIRLDPRRRDALKRLAAEAGMRPGELALLWLQERLDTEGRGDHATPGDANIGQALAELREQVGRLERRIEALAPREASVAETVESTGDGAGPPQHDGGGRVALHDEITAVLAERGPMRAGELAQAIIERGRYRAPRSAKPLDAAAVNSRVSNPHYRDRFVRREGRIALADTD